MHTPTVDQIWEATQAQLRAVLTPEIYRLWFAPLRVHGAEGDDLTLEVADDFCEVWIKDNYRGLIQDLVARAAGRSAILSEQQGDWPDVDVRPGLKARRGLDSSALPLNSVFRMIDHHHGLAVEDYAGVTAGN